MHAALQLDIISPEQHLLSASVSMVLIPGADGIFGVLPRHMNLIAEVAPGIVEVHYSESKKEKFYISHGAAQVTATSCSILVGEAMPVEGVDIPALHVRLDSLRHSLRASESERESLDLAAEIKYIEMILANHTKAS